MLRVAIILVMLLAGTAEAQIVNVQGALAKAPEQDGQVGEVSLKIVWREGNNPLFDVGGAGSVLVRRGRFLGLALARGGYGRSRGVTLTEKTFEHLRARVTLDCRWRWEVLAQHEFDRFRRLSLRAVAGTGPAILLVDEPRGSLLAGAAYLFELEKLDRRMGARDGGAETFAHRASLYVTGRQDLSSTAAIVETLYLQPRIDELGDLRVLGELAVQTQLTKHFALKDSFTMSYDNAPPDLVQRLDLALEVSLIASF